MLKRSSWGGSGGSRGDVFPPPPAPHSMLAAKQHHRLNGDYPHDYQILVAEDKTFSQVVRLPSTVLHPSHRCAILGGEWGISSALVIRPWSRMPEAIIF